MELTGEEMTLKIAMALGYKTSGDGSWSKPPDKRGTVVSGPMDRIVPKFHKSLDAMFTARESMTDREKASYQINLSKLSKILDATPRDHCEAFLKTKGLWPTPTEVGAVPKTKPALEPVGSSD